MRKTPTLLVGLLATGAIAGTAVAQTAGSHSLNVGVSPSDAGTKSKPKAVTFRLDISNNREAGTTASRIEINLPSGLKMNPKGFPICSQATIEDRGVGACPSKSRLGAGTAGAVVNPNAASDDDPSTNTSNLTFKNTFFVGGSNFLNIFLVQTPGDVRAVLKGTISNGGRRLSIPIPEDLQQPSAGIYSALTDIKTSLKGTAGRGSKKHGFFELSKCSGNAIKVSTRLTYAANPQPPAAPTSVATDSTPCKR